MTFHRPTQRQWLAAAAAFAGCVAIAAGAGIAAKAGPGPAPPPDPRRLTIALEAPPEPEIVDGPPMQVLSNDAPHAFDLDRYRQELAALRAQTLADAQLFGGASLSDPRAEMDAAQGSAPPTYALATEDWPYRR